MQPGISRPPPMSQAVLQQPLSRPTQTCLLSRLRLLELGRKQIKQGVALRMGGSIAVVYLPLLACLLRRSLLRSDQPRRTCTIATLPLTPICCLRFKPTIQAHELFLLCM